MTINVSTVELTIPTISVFLWYVIQMFWREHNPPHFHALYGEHEAVFYLRDFRGLPGALPRRAMVFVLEWATDPRDELIQSSP